MPVCGSTNGRTYGPEGAYTTGGALSYGAGNTAAGYATGRTASLAAGSGGPAGYGAGGPFGTGGALDFRSGVCGADSGGFLGPHGCAGICCKMEAVVTGTNWVHVGQGGAYTKVQNYNFVGEGGGSYEKEVVTKYYGWKVRKCCIGLLGLMLLAGLLCLLATLTGSEGSTESVANNVVIQTPAPTPGPAIIATTSPHFDCEAKGPWSDDHKRWCCTNYGRGCPGPTTRPPATTRPPVAAPTTPRVSFDCKAGLVNWVKGWSANKKLWCCKHRSIGCHAPVAQTAVSSPAAHGPEPFKCTAGLANFWGPQQRAWCCQVKHVGCQAPRPSAAPAATSLPFDCSLDYINCYHCLEMRWSPAKRSWCCQHGGRGCTTASPALQTTAPPSVVPTQPAAPPEPPTTTQAGTTSLAFNCQAGLAHWSRDWSVAKKAYCCQHEHRGCPTPPPASLPYDCDADFTTCHHCLLKRWSKGKQDWCCRRVGRGCPAPATSSLPYDCDAGFHRWQRVWGPVKQSWCCQHMDRGCPASKKPAVTSM